MALAGERSRRVGGQERREVRPRTRGGGPVTFRGVEYASPAGLERALTEAVVGAGWRVTPAGEAYLAGWRERGAPGRGAR